MRIIIEEYPYKASDVRHVLEGLSPLENVKGEVSVNYVGYFFNAKLNDCVFILPKVLLNEKGYLFETVDDKRCLLPEQIIDFDSPEVDALLKPGERDFIYEFAVWIYRAIAVYNQTENDIVYTRKILETGKGGKRRRGTFLDIIVTMLRFNRENQNFFMQVLRNIHSGFNKINWNKTISTSTALVSNDLPVYANPVNKKRQINFDEELLVIFFSILNYIHERFGFPVMLNLGYDLIKGKKFDSYLKGQGRRRLKQIKYKYFSDKALRIWELCYDFFERSAESVNTTLKEYLLAKNFNIVFEGIINTLIGDNDVPDKLINQRDGKIVDHIFTHRGLTTYEEDKKVYYIGDSKYYKIGNQVTSESVHKQYTYARNLVQWNLDLFNNPDSSDSRRYRDSHRPYRDDTTEGYNIIPNFFISAKLTDGLKYTDHVEPREKPFIQRQFKNRLFDRDTLLISHYDVNFLFIISLYARNNAGQRAAWRDSVRDIFRREIQRMLQANFDFYAMTARKGVDPKQYLQTHFQETLGKVFSPYENKEYFSLALDSAPEFREENDKTLALLGRVFHIRRLDGMGIDPTNILTEAVNCASGEVVKPVETDMTLLIMFDNVHDVVNRPFNKVAQGLSLSESALRITSDLASVKYIVLHNKRDYYIYRTAAAPRLASKKDIGEDVICKLKKEELYIVFDVDPADIKGVELNTARLAAARGDDRISYYSTMLPFSKLV